jgi:lysozyme
MAYTAKSLNENERESQNMMNVEKIKKLIIKHEGLKLKPYKCTSGKLTIGVGRNIEDVGISEDEAMFMLDNDIEKCIKDMVRLFPRWYQLSENRQSVLVNMRFNLGLTGFRKFGKMIKFVNAQSFFEAAFEMQDSLWYKQVGNRAIELVDMMERG